MKHPILFWTMAALVLTLSACSPPLSKEAMQKVDSGLDYALVKAQPQGHVGKTLLLGGLIADNIPTDQGSTLIIVKYKLSRWHEPDAPDHEGGRFLALSRTFLDPAIFERGRLVTMAGTLRGTEKRPLGETAYTYPAFEVEEIHLWPEERYPDPFYYPYDPIYPYRYRSPYRHYPWW